MHMQRKGCGVNEAGYFDDQYQIFVCKCSLLYSHGGVFDNYNSSGGGGGGGGRVDL